MNAEFRRVKEIFLAAVEKPDPAERDAYLREACGQDEELRRQVDALLGKHAQAGSFLESPARGPVATVDEPPSSERPGAVIGPYKLIEPIGEGGMGMVWMAQQTEPVKRLVAVKLIKAGMDSKQVIARFEAERQALALMDHPNIARVLDGGTTSAGRPYFVMDLVKGVPITRYCDEHHLTPRQRLELFVPVCQAVQHAHQKGIIHRDLKPSNVLVAPYDGKPVPKVIDFGVAKAAGQPLTDKTLVTGFGNVVGTLEYMSPEQAELNNHDIDTRSDIYALGVLLYELLAGSPPFSRKELEQAGMLEMLRVIREQEPSKPSTKLSTAEGLPTLAANRGTEPAKLTRLVRGELDWIVMKALEKDRSRRYETANGFAQDVQRYLVDEPVQACPPSAGYRFRKFARRNKVGLAVAALVLFFLVILGSGAGWAVRDRSAREAEAARQQAARQGKVAGQVESIFAEEDRLEAEQKWPEALVAVRRAEAAVAGGEADPATAQRVRERIKDLEFIHRMEQIRMEAATTVEGRFDFSGVGRDYAGAFSEYGVAVEALAVEESIQRFKARPALAIPVAAALDDWVAVRRWPGLRREVAGCERLVAVARGIDPEPLRDRLRATWGQPLTETPEELRRLADTIDVRAQHPATLVIFARTLPFSARSVAESRLQQDAALRLLKRACTAYPGDFWLNFELGNKLIAKDNEEAVRFYSVAVAIRPDSGNAHYQLGVALGSLKRLDEAIACFRKATELNPKAAVAFNGLGVCLLGQKKLDEAVACFRTAIEINPGLTYVYVNLADALCTQGKLDDAIVAYRQVLVREKDYATLSARTSDALRAQGKLDDATVAIQERANKDFIHTKSILASLLSERAWQLATGADPKSRDPGRAVALAEEAIQLNPGQSYLYWKILGVAHYRSENWKAAANALEKSRQLNPYYQNDSVILFFLSMTYERLNEKIKSRKCYQQAAHWRLGIGSNEEQLRRLCAEAADLLGVEVPPTLKEPPILTPGPSLLMPAAGAILDNGANDGSKLRVWEFNWSEVPGATRYHLYVIGPTATLPVINNLTLTAPSYRDEGKGYFATQYRLGYRWKVRALVNGTWTDWSEERTFDVTPVAENKAAPSK
jgi:serine/threonine protein kinase/tetratricopeptide (TPR) repeat protein